MNRQPRDKKEESRKRLPVNHYASDGTMVKQHPNELELDAA
jgi:hypothetical protein